MLYGHWIVQSGQDRPADEVRAFKLIDAGCDRPESVWWYVRQDKDGSCWQYHTGDLIAHRVLWQSHDDEYWGL